MVSVPTRKSARLEIVLTDLHTFYHPVTTISPLQVDTNKKGKDSDHEIVLFAPKSDPKYVKERKKTVVKTRPLSIQQITEFEQELSNFPWDETFKDITVDDQVELFHSWLKTHLDLYFPEKSTTFSSLDKRWMSPGLKTLHRKMQREYCKNRNGVKYKKLKSKFRKCKRKSIKSYFERFVIQLKSTSPGKWYQMAKRVGAVGENERGNIEVESLSGFTNKECADEIAHHFAAISNEYKPIDHCRLPCYLPAQPPPKVEEYEVYRRLRKIKKSKSTLPIDLPDELRKECAAHLSVPLTIIINSSLAQSVYPQLWKQEWVTPVPKISHPKTISDLRKISCTSDFSKTFEGFLKEWILQDISANLDKGQFGGQAGLGTEHLMVCFIDRILGLLDKHPDRSAVIATSLDWSAAFDRQDPTLVISKFIKLGVRPSLIPLLSSYLTDRQMKVKFNEEMSEFLTLIGGNPQGTLLGQLGFLVQSDDNAITVSEKDRFKYIDDLSLIHLVMFADLLSEYDTMKHVPSDIGIDDAYLPPEAFKTQQDLDSIAHWTSENLALLNEKKCSYMVFSRSQTRVSTRLTLNEKLLERVSSTDMLGMKISDDLSWDANCQSICQKAYSKIGILTKLKYAGWSWN